MLATNKKTLSVSCVYYDTPIDVFEKTLASLSKALEFARKQNLLNNYNIHLINNNNQKLNDFKETAKKYSMLLNNPTLHTDQGNIGYGRANNIAIQQTNCEFHLILNPDVTIEEAAIAVGLDHLNNHSEVGLVAPHATNAKGEMEYLAKRTPNLWILFLRAANKPLLNKLFKRRLDAYAYKDKIPTNQPLEIELASGCFMLCRTSTLKLAGGFSEQYFLYFEDFDLSHKLRKIAKLVHLPTMKICHLGGQAHSKGVRHTKLFLTSYFIFIKTCLRSKN